MTLPNVGCGGGTVMAGKARGKAASKTIHGRHFPGESEGYRSARDDLLHEEIELRRALERVAERRRGLPYGGTVPEDYEFEEGAADLSESQSVQRVKLSALFRSGWTSL